MAIRQRTWTSGGKEKSAWVVEYFDPARKWRLRPQTKKEAQDFEATVRIDIEHGQHVANSADVTVEEAGKLWLETAKKNELVEGTTRTYCQHHTHHIAPFLGSTKLSKLTVPLVRAFEEQLLANGAHRCSPRRCLAASAPSSRRHGARLRHPQPAPRNAQGSQRAAHEGRPRPQEAVEDRDGHPGAGRIRAILHAASGFRRAFFATAALSGLRASELRGLIWPNVDFAKGAISVVQRADKWGTIDVTKSEAGERVVPVPALVINALREWKLQCPWRDTGKKDEEGKPVAELHFVFPTGKGRVENLENIVQRHWWPLQVAAGVSVPEIDETGNPVMSVDEDGQPIPVMAPKYTGLHALRHFFCRGARLGRRMAASASRSRRCRSAWATRRSP